MYISCSFISLMNLSIDYSKIYVNSVAASSKLHKYIHTYHSTYVRS